MYSLQVQTKSTMESNLGEKGAITVVMKDVVFEGRSVQACGQRLGEAFVKPLDDVLGRANY
jgi:hypothetical protein